MTTEHLIPEDLRHLYQTMEWRNATAILSAACPNEWRDIIHILRRFRLLSSEILTAGGGHPPIARQINGELDNLGWMEKRFEVKTIVDNQEALAASRIVDCCKGKVAIQLEWNNKPAFFDRDLEDFQFLYDTRAIDVGVIITRSTDLQGILLQLGRAKNYGLATTHHGQLWPRMANGGAGGCPVLAFAITPNLYIDDGPEAAVRARAQKDAENQETPQKTGGVSPAAGWDADDGEWS